MIRVDDLIYSKAGNRSAVMAKIDGKMEFVGVMGKNRQGGITWVDCEKKTGRSKTRRGASHRLVERFNDVNGASQESEVA